MTGRLVWAVISTLLEEAALVVIVLWGLPRLGIEIPLPGLIALGTAWGVFSVITYRMGSQALRRKPVIGLPAMVGSKGKAASPLAPGGFVKIKGELWEATSTGDRIETDDKVIVVGQDGLKLIVNKSGTSDLGRSE